MSLRPYCILLHAELLYTHTLRVSGLVVLPMIPHCCDQISRRSPQWSCLTRYLFTSREFKPYILWHDLHPTHIVYFQSSIARCKAQSSSLTAMMWVLVIKIGPIKHMTHSFAVLELFEILINIFLRSSILVITLS